MIDYDTTTTSDFQKMKLKGQQELVHHFDGNTVALFPLLPATKALEGDSNKMIGRSGFAAGADASCKKEVHHWLEHKQSSDTASTAASSHPDNDQIEPLVTATQALLALNSANGHDEEKCHPKLGVCSSPKKRSHRTTHHQFHRDFPSKSDHYGDDDCWNKMHRNYLDDFPTIEWTEDGDLPPFVNCYSMSLNAIDKLTHATSASLSFLLTPRTSSCANEGLVRSKSFGSQLNSLHIIQGPIG